MSEVRLPIRAAGVLGAAYAAQVAGAAVALAWIARELTPGEFGGFAAGLAVGSFAAMLCDAGLTRWVWARVAGDEAVAAALHRKGSARRLTFCLAALPMAAGATVALCGTSHLAAAALLPAAALAQGQAGFSCAVLRGVKRTEWEVWVNVGVQAALLALLAATFGGSNGLTGAAAAWCGSRVLGAGLAYGLAARAARMAAPAPVDAALDMAASSRLLVASAGAFAYLQADLLFVKAFRPEEEAGLYGLAVRVMSLAALPVEVWVSATYAGVAEAERRSPGQVGALLRRVGGVSLLLIAPACGLLLIAPEFVLRLVGGEEYAGAAGALRWLAAGYIFLYGPPHRQHLAALAEERHLGRSGLAMGALTLAACAAFVPSGGFVAAAIVSCATYAIMKSWDAGVYLRRARRATRELA